MCIINTSRTLAKCQIQCSEIATFLTIDLDSTWNHWSTLWRHSDLFWAATSTSSQVIPILNKSLLTVLLQFVCRRPGSLVNCGTSQCNACTRYTLVIHSYHMSKPAESKILKSWHLDPAKIYTVSQKTCKLWYIEIHENWSTQTLF